MNLFQGFHKFIKPKENPENRTAKLGFWYGTKLMTVLTSHGCKGKTCSLPRDSFPSHLSAIQHNKQLHMSATAGVRENTVTRFDFLLHLELGKTFSAMKKWKLIMDRSPFWKKKKTHLLKMRVHPMSVIKKSLYSHVHFAGCKYSHVFSSLQIKWQNCAQQSPANLHSIQSWDQHLGQRHTAATGRSV